MVHLFGAGPALKQPWVNVSCMLGCACVLSCKEALLMSRSQKFVFIVGQCRRSEGRPSIKSTLVQRLLLTLTGAYWV